MMVIKLIAKNGLAFQDSTSDDGKNDKFFVNLLQTSKHCFIFKMPFLNQIKRNLYILSKNQKEITLQTQNIIGSKFKHFV